VSDSHPEDAVAVDVEYAESAAADADAPAGPDAPATSDAPRRSPPASDERLRDLGDELSRRDARGLLGDDPTAVLDRLHRLSYYLDDLVPIPGTNYRIGLDPLLGLLPVVGDAPTTALSAYVVAEAAALGVPRETLARMTITLLLDATVGSLPLVGDAFDAVWKANARNVRLLDARTRAGGVDPGARSADRRFVLAVAAVLFVGLLAVAAGTTLAAWWLVGQLGLL